MSKIDIDAKLINYSWLMTHCPPGHYDTSLGPIFLKIDRQTHCETGTMFLTSEVDIDAKLINYSWLMTHCQPGRYDTSLCPNFLEIDRQTHCNSQLLTAIVTNLIKRKLSENIALFFSTSLRQFDMRNFIFFHISYNIKLSFVSLLLFYSSVYYVSILNQGNY